MYIVGYQWPQWNDSFQFGAQAESDGIRGPFSAGLFFLYLWFDGRDVRCRCNRGFQEKYLALARIVGRY